MLCLLLAKPVGAQSSKNQGVVEIDDLSRYSQVLAISDVHGTYPKLLKLLRGAKVVDTQNAWSAGKTLLIVCGDSIDKGSQSLEVLQLWMQLTAKAPASGGHVVVLLGNHEAEFLKDPNNKKTAVFQTELGEAKITSEELEGGTDSKGIGNFLRAMPVAARAGKFLFCHAGWYPAETSWSEFVAKSKRLLLAGKYEDAFLTGPHSILEEKEETPEGSPKAVKWYNDPASVQGLEARMAALNLYGVVFGHQPHAFGFQEKIGGVDHLHILKIDTGMDPHGDDSAGEILRFPHPLDLLKMAQPESERLLPNGSHASVEILQTPTAER